MFLGHVCREVRMVVRDVTKQSGSFCEYKDATSINATSLENGRPLAGCPAISGELFAKYK